MDKRVYFFCGLILAGVASIPIYLGISSSVEISATYAASWIFVVTVSLFLVATAVFIFRDKILSAIGARPIRSIEDVTQDFRSVAGAIGKRDPEMIASSSAKFAEGLAVRYAWLQFYRWTVGSIVTLLAAMAAFAGTFLLLDQNQKIEDQNTIQAVQNELQLFDIIRSIRQILLSETITLDETSEIPFPDPFLGRAGDCRVFLRADKTFAGPLNPSSVTAVVVLAQQSESLQTKVVTALSLLTEDQSPIVKLGALRALEELDIGPQTEDSTSPSEYVGIVVGQASYPRMNDTTFRNSLVLNDACENCGAKAVSSIVNSGLQTRANYSIVYDFPKSTAYLGFANILLSNDVEGNYYGNTEAFPSHTLWSSYYSKTTEERKLLRMNDRGQLVEANCIYVNSICEASQSLIECQGPWQIAPEGHSK